MILEHRKFPRRFGYPSPRPRIADGVRRGFRRGDLVFNDDPDSDVGFKNPPSGTFCKSAIDPSLTFFQLGSLS